MNQNVLFFLKNKSEVKYLYGDMNVSQALDEMKIHKYTAVPVINNEGEYLGTITEGDFLWHIQSGKPLDVKIKHLIRKEFCKPVQIDTNIDSLIQQSLHQNFVPIIDDRYIFIGIVTRKTLLEYLFNERA